MDRLTRVTSIAFVVAPVLLLIDNLLHPKEFEPGNEAAQLEAIADAYEGWQIAHTIGWIGGLFFLVAVLGLAAILYDRRPRAAVWGGALAGLGLFAFSSVFALDGFTWGVLGELSAREDIDGPTIQRTLDEIQNSPWSLPYYLAAIGFIAGMIVLAVGSVRGHLLTPVAGTLLIIATLMTGTETAIISNTYFIAGAAVFVAAGIAVALSLRREQSGARAST